MTANDPPKNTGDGPINRTRPATILVADDDKSIRTVLTRALGRMGHHVRATGQGTTLWKWVQEGAGDMVITDVMMPDGNGLDLLPNIRHLRPDMKIVVISAQNTLMTAVTATERGAFEYVPKPFDLAELTTTVAQALASRPDGSVHGTKGLPAKPQPGLNRGSSPGSRPLQSPLAEGSANQAAERRGGPSATTEQSLDGDVPFVDQLPMVGRSDAMQDLYRVMARVVSARVDVMLHGPPGVGKDLVARTIHSLAGGASNNFVVVNLAAMSPERIDLALFGAPETPEKGAVARARGGTLLLDEVGDYGPQAQAIILSLLQSDGFWHPHLHEHQSLDCRVVSATHRDMARLVEAGRFRADLLYRLDELAVRVPPLKDRKADIPALVDYFATLFAPPSTKARGQTRVFTDGAKQVFQEHHWPGNVRELRNIVKRLLVLYSQSEIDADLVRREMEGLRPARAVGQAPPSSALPGGAGGLDVAGYDPSVPAARRVQTGEAEGLNTLAGSITAHLESYFAAHGEDLPSPGLHARLLREVEAPLLTLCLEATGGNQIKAAEVLGLNRNTVRKKIRELSIQITLGGGSSNRT